MTTASVGKFTTNLAQGFVAVAGVKDGAVLRCRCLGDLKKGMQESRQDSSDGHLEPRAGLNVLIYVMGVDMTLAFSVK